MKKPYKLLLFSTKTLHQNDIFNSVNMNSYGLITEFSKLPHVELSISSSVNDLTSINDFVLIHTYFDQKIFKNLHIVRENTKYHIMNMMEISHHSKLIDHHFIYRTDYISNNTTYIEHPIINELIQPTLNDIKLTGSILIDHVIKDDQVYTNYSPILYEWLESIRSNRFISQLERKGWEDSNTIFPEWIHKIRESNYPTYLQNTSKFENYILTHVGSYEHSVIDMVSRGCRVIVPEIGGRPFCPPSLVNSLKLPTFSTKEQLLKILNEPIKKTHVEFTDISKIVSIIDDYCQSLLND